MTLEEAIKHLEESLADPGHDWGCEECKAEHEQLAEWLRELKELREENKVLMQECDRLIKEKGELLGKVSGGDVLRICQLEEQLKAAKRLLKAAVEDFHDVLTSQIKITNYTLCAKCKYYLNCNCKDKCIARYNLKQWRFADEALKLIGEESERNA